jgi:cytochrome c-type biogenesis protein
LSYLIAFAGGLITFLSPCILPLFPVYIAYISGITAGELEASRGQKPFYRIFINTLLFTAGFTVVFSCLSILLSIFVQILGSFKTWFNRVAGIVIVIFGLHMMGVMNIQFLNREVRFKPDVKKKSPLSSFIMGAAFGGGWTPCIGPVLSGILFTASAQNGPLTSLLMLVVYSLGLGIPFMLTGLFTERILSFFNGVKRHYRIIEIISGIFVIALGVSLIFDLTGFVSGALSGILPWPADIEGRLK